MFGRYLVGGQINVSGEDIIFSADFSALNFGGYSSSDFLSATGLNFSRASDSTIQTSSSSIVSTAGGNDYACIGSSDGIKKGVVIQPCTYNLLSGSTSPRNLGNAWASGSGITTFTYPFSASPDETNSGCTRVAISSGGFAQYGLASFGCFSSWQRSFDFSSNGDMQQVWILSTPGDGLSVVRSATNTWGRIITATTNSYFYIDVCDGRDYTASSGQGSQARDILVDYIQLERGLNATEAIPTAGTIRRSDRLSHPDASQVVAPNGQIKTYFKFYPKHSSSVDVSYSDVNANSGEEANWYLWSFSDADHYLKIKASDKKIYAKNGGSEIVSSNAISWTANDLVEIYIELGANITSSAQYRINGGSWNNLNLPTLSETFAPDPDPLGLCYNVDNTADLLDTGHLMCRLSEIKFFGTVGMTL